ncbi:MAG: molybdopterin molybdotransferase MoeA [Verrucomicrobia bacterium]|nr:molybdopterin molybdotransferase MoeA [Verrucomicrobiota bacterium]
MLTIEAAQARILDAVKPSGEESVALADACGRFLAADISSPIELPPFDNSAMDGYAVRASDVAGASAERPAALRVIGRAPAGSVFAGELAAGDCVRLFTGSPLPRGADAVVMQEDCRAEADRVLVLDAVKPWENVRFAGEDVKRGALLAARGTRLGFGHISLLAATGVARVSVGRAPRAGILGTGDELREAGGPLAPGQIFESNRAGLALLARRAGAVPEIFPIVRDEPAAVRAALRAALDACDVVISSGGVSVGEHDFVKEAFTQLGGTVGFWQVAMKPGKPLVFGQCGGKFFFGLPGNPVSALVCFLVFVAPALARWQGATEPLPPLVPGELLEALENRGDRPHFLRVTQDARGGVRSAGTQASHVLNSLASANGLVRVPPRTALPPGERVGVMRWE